MKPAERSGAAALVAVTMLWGISFPLVGDAVAGRTIGQLLLFLVLRFSLGAIAFFPVAGRIRAAARGLGWAPWGYALAVAVLLFFSHLTQTAGLRITTPSRSAFVTVLAVPMVPLLAAIRHRRAPSKPHLFGSLLATVGVGFVLSPGGSIDPNTGDWWTLLSAFLYALEILLLEHVTRRAPVLPLAFGQIAGVALFAAIALLFVPLELPASWPGLSLAVGVTGIGCTTLALGLMTWGQGRVTAEVAAMIFALEPIFAAIFEWIYLGLGLNALQWGGGVVVFVAVVFTARVPVREGG